MGHERSDHVVTDERLQQVYQASMAWRPADCPPPEALQALARREGEEATRLETLDHAMRCASCRAELDLLRSIEMAGAAAARPARRPWLVPAALAATVLLAVGLGSLILPHGDEPLRSGEEAGAVAVLAPSAEAAAGEPLTFVWRPSPGAIRYRVEVMSGSGEVAIEAETRDTAVTLDAVGRLAPGDYRWWVVALTPRPGPRSALRPLRLIAR